MNVIMDLIKIDVSSATIMESQMPTIARSAPSSKKTEMDALKSST